MWILWLLENNEAIGLESLDSLIEYATRKAEESELGGLDLGANFE